MPEVSQEGGAVRTQPKHGTCLHCKRDCRLERRGLCSPCYLKPDVREQYPPMDKSVAGKLGADRADANRAAGIPIRQYAETEWMPCRVFAVVRMMRSRISGKLPVMLRWFPDCDKAMKFARKHARRYTLAVYEWVGTGDSWNKETGRRMVQTRVAVVRRRVAA